ncbi:WD repeat-containing protein 63 [Rhizophlyctis rosea]|uniref:WD repeat-containing protein 63 n=1 Tax=Rhizophlyctis rosea TaxID=64517 RepID=A0AAD5SJ35_9FUNG|nr:WD repeat-containing protein 63 [Rhizophlyctis rosea]
MADSVPEEVETTDAPTELPTGTPRAKSREGASRGSRRASRSLSKSSLAADRPKSVLETVPAGDEPPTMATSDPAEPENTGPPPGVIPLFLSSMTQEIFKVRAGEDVTAESPIKMIPKADLLADMHARAAISDFTPVKQQINDFPQDEMLLQYDPTFKYDCNFLLCVTVEAMEAILHPVIAKEAEEEVATALLAGPKKPPESKPWVSLGSDKEIEAEMVVHNRQLIHVKVSRKRREFGSPCKFGDRDGHDGFTECRPFRDPTYEITRMELPAAVQAVPELVDADSQTAWFRPVNLALQYEPVFLSDDQRREALGSDSIEEFVRDVSIRFEKALQQNNMIDIFDDDYQNLGEEDVALEQGAHTYLQEYQSFTDLKHSKDKSISCVDWHPTIKGVVGISCVQRLAFDEWVEKGFPMRSKQSLILIWSFHDPIIPQLMLEAPEDVGCFQFNPYDPNLVIGGLKNGQLILWDIGEYSDKLKSNRKSGKDNGGDESIVGGGLSGGGNVTGGDKGERQTDVPIVHWLAVSSIEASHRAPVTDVQWLPRSLELGQHGEVLEKGENGHRQLVTTSLDGQVCFWDMRYKKEWTALDLVWRPFLRVPLSSMDNTFDYGLTKISIHHDTSSGDQTAASKRPSSPDKPRPTSSEKPRTASAATDKGPVSRFYCATEEGDLIFANWMGEKSSEEKGAVLIPRWGSGPDNENFPTKLASRVEHAFQYHFGPMSDLQRSPFFPDVLLSVGGWSFHLWKEGVTSGPLLSSAPSQSYLICARWSPTRPGVFFVSKADGTVEIWDLLDRSHLPSTVQNISSIPVSYMAIHQYPTKSQTHNQFIAAGDDEGTLHILEVPRNLIKPSKNEKSFVRAFFDREVRRLAYVQQRKVFRANERGKFEAAALEALTAKAKKEGDTMAAPVEGTAPGTPAAAAPAAEGGGGPSKAEDEEEKAEVEYRKMERT